MNVIGSKWVYKTKLNSDGSIERFKRKLVAQGYSQIYELDLDAAFPLVITLTSIHVILSIAVIDK